MISRPAKPGKQWDRGLTVPMIFCLTILLACRVQVSSASGWFTAKTVLGLSSGNHENLGASGGVFAVSLTGPVREELAMSTGDMENLFQDIGEQDFASAEKRLGQSTAQSPDVDRDDSVSGRAFQLCYTFTYLNYGENFPEVNVRFRLNHAMSNMVMLNGSEQKCVQTLLYMKSDGDSVPMPSITFAGQDRYYYYPMPLKPGESIELKYLLYLPEGLESESNDDRLLLSYETIAASNNASVFKWNVVFQDETATPFDNSTCVETPYAPYLTNFIWTERPPQSDETEPHTEGQAGTGREEEPVNRDWDEPIVSEDEKNNERSPRGGEEETPGRDGAQHIPADVEEDSRLPKDGDVDVEVPLKKSGQAILVEGKVAFAEYD